MKFSVIIPAAELVVVKFIQDDRTGIATINESLVSFSPKLVFAHHASILIHLESADGSGLPLAQDLTDLEKFENRINDFICLANPTKPNGLFLARILWNQTVELIWRVCQPEPVAKFLNQIIATNNSPVSFDYRIDPDKDWTLAQWHLSAVNG